MLSYAVYALSVAYRRLQASVLHGQTMLYMRSVLFRVFCGIVFLAGCSASVSKTADQQMPANSATRVDSACEGLLSADPADSYLAGSPEIESDGDELLIRLTLLDPYTCAPLEGVLVDIWHAGISGYSPGSYRVKGFSDSSGLVEYATINPNPENGVRHIHVRAMHNNSEYWWVLMLDDSQAASKVIINSSLIVAYAKSAVTSIPTPEVNY